MGVTADAWHIWQDQKPQDGHQEAVENPKRLPEDPESQATSWKGAERRFLSAPLPPNPWAKIPHFR